jgi:mono/diheme cytochrome c family protein
MSRLVLMSVLAVASAGCAAAGPHGELDRPPAAVERGRAMAQRQCAPCHAVALGESALPNAPAFREIAPRYNAVAFERRVREMAAGRHDQMPAVELAPNDASDLAAYIKSLNAALAP